MFAYLMGLSIFVTVAGIYPFTDPAMTSVLNLLQFAKCYLICPHSVSSIL